MSEIVTLGERALNMAPGSIVEGVNGDYAPSWRERFVRSLLCSLCWVVRHRYLETKEYRRVKPPFTITDVVSLANVADDVPVALKGKLVQEMLDIITHPVYLMRSIQQCSRCKHITDSGAHLQPKGTP